MVHREANRRFDLPLFPGRLPPPQGNKLRPPLPDRPLWSDPPASAPSAPMSPRSQQVIQGCGNGIYLAHPSAEAVKTHPEAPLVLGHFSHGGPRSYPRLRQIMRSQNERSTTYRNKTEKPETKSLKPLNITMITASLANTALYKTSLLATLVSDERRPRLMQK